MKTKHKVRTSAVWVWVGDQKGIYRSPASLPRPVRDAMAKTAEKGRLAKVIIANAGGMDELKRQRTENKAKSEPSLTETPLLTRIRPVAELVALGTAGLAIWLALAARWF